MLDFLKDWTINIVMLVLFIVIIEMLLPKGKMKKYVNLLTGTILIIVIIEPITGLFGKNFDFAASQAMASGNIDKKEIEKAGKLLEEEQLKQTLELYRKRIIEQITLSAEEVEGVKEAQADVIINEDPGSEYFGEIKRIYINAVMEGKDQDADGSTADMKSASKGGTAPDGEDTNTGSIPSEKDDIGKEAAITVERVENIKVGGLTWNDPDSVVYDAGLNRRLSDRIGEVFGVESENIIIKQIQR
jgi:stage III sporulation protein AF